MPLTTKQLAILIHKHRGLLLPVAALTLIFVILVPLPTSIMDVLLLVNITLSGIVLLTVMYIDGPLSFSSFPSLLLGLTLFRLVLNTATTRLILTHGNAGHVVQAFGSFVAQGSLAVAIIIFVIIVIIQFVVITKGATRIAEVAARFTLDGMPGKQMAVDADLNAGTITDEEAKRRRADITREADFYGAMDGASKFVRGDAVAGLLIILINILGGVYVGMVEQRLPIMETLRKYTILTIGDGLVSQIPAFIVSVAASMIVTRSASKANLGEELIGQLTAQPVALALTGGLLLTLALTPLPKVPLIVLAASCAITAHLLTRKQKLAVAVATAARAKPAAPERVERHLVPDTLELAIGYGLIRLVDRKQGGDLLDRITNLRRQIAGEIGIVVPPIQIRDDVQLKPNQVRLRLRGVDLKTAEVMPGNLLAIDSGAVTDPIRGMETTDPTFGLRALWIEESQRHDAEYRNYTVVDASTVISTFISELVKRHADELLTRQEVSRLLENLKEKSPKLVEEVVPKAVSMGEVQRVLQALLRERVSIRNLELILETLGDWAPRTKDTEILTEYARNSLARIICHSCRADDGKIHCVTLDPALEELINKGLDRSDRGTFITMPPRLQKRVVHAIRSEVERAMPKSRGRLPVVLCAPQIRATVRRMIEPLLPAVPVLSYSEIVRGTDLESDGIVVLTDETENIPG